MEGIGLQGIFTAPHYVIKVMQDYTLKCPFIPTNPHTHRHLPTPFAIGKLPCKTGPISRRFVGFYPHGHARVSLVDKTAPFSPYSEGGCHWFSLAGDFFFLGGARHSHYPQPISVPFWSEVRTFAPLSTCRSKRDAGSDACYKR